MNSKKKDKNGCMFRPLGVQCYEANPHRCAKCGWNPEVEEKRIAQIRERSHEKRVRRKS